MTSQVHISLFPQGTLGRGGPSRCPYSMSRAIGQIIRGWPTGCQKADSHAACWPSLRACGYSGGAGPVLHGNQAGSPVFARCPSEMITAASRCCFHSAVIQVKFLILACCSGFYKPAEGPLVKTLNQGTGNIGLNRSLITDLIHRGEGA